MMMQLNCSFGKMLKQQKIRNFQFYFLNFINDGKKMIDNRAENTMLCWCR
jgi:hypothetical protein